MGDRAVRVGIAGPSCSGKSTVARILAERLGAARLCLDDFYLRAHERRHVEVGGRLVKSFEHPGAYDGRAVLDAVAAATGPVVAEGFLLFRYPGWREAFDVALFVDLPWDEIVRRRAARAGQCTPAAEESFAALGASEWEAFGAGQGELPGVVLLDGCREPDALAADALACLRALVARS